MYAVGTLSASPCAGVLARRTHLRYPPVSSCRRVELRVGRGMAWTVRKAL
jgi:hypothetical protein